jgi:hypothetical protein
VRAKGYVSTLNTFKLEVGTVEATPQKVTLTDLPGTHHDEDIVYLKKTKSTAVEVLVM